MGDPADPLQELLAQNPIASAVGAVYVAMSGNAGFRDPESVFEARESETTMI